MAIKLVAIDLDDTLLNSSLQIAQPCREAIRQVQDLGIMVTLATGRMYRSALPYAQQIKADLPLITYQGALVKNSFSEEVLYYRPVPEELTIEVMEYFQRAQVHFHTYIEDELCLESMTEEGRAYANMARVEPRMVPDLLAAVREKQPLKIMAITENEKALLDMELELKSHYGKLLNITRSKPHYLEVMDRSANKADALQVIAQHFGIDRSEVLAVGDSYNDLAMIEWAGVGVAMGNARDVVKDAADHVTKSNEEAGVAEALHRYVLSQHTG